MEAEKQEEGPDPAHTRTKMFNIFLLGLCFCFVFTGFNTMGQSQALIYESAEDYIPGFEVSGFISNGIVYGVFAFASWLSPSIVLKLGPRISMILASLTYLFNISQLLYLNPYSIYISAAILGFGAPIIWTAQGTYLSNNSDPDTITRNSGVFWAMNMSSLFIGNLFAYFVFKDAEQITESRKNLLGWSLTAISGVGTLLMFFLRPTPWVKSKSDVKMLKTMQGSWLLLLTPNMLMFCIVMFYTGLQQSMWGGIYTTSIGFTVGFGGDRKSLAMLSGVIVATGEVLGGIVFGFLGHVTVKKGRDPIIMLGFLLSMVAYFLMFINLPFDSTLGETEKEGYWGPSREIALVTSFLLGFSDACFNTQVTAILGGFWRDQSASAFGLFKFFQSLASAISFYYTGYLEIEWQLLIVVIFGFLGTIACVKVELSTQKSSTEEKGSSPSTYDDSTKEINTEL